MTNQQGAPEALRLRNYVERRKRAKQLDVNKVHAFDTGCGSEAELLLSDIETLLSLVEAQQPAPSAQQPFGWIKQHEIDVTNKFGGSISLWRRQYDCDVPVYLAPQPSPTPRAPFQQRVQPWLLECFGAEIAADRVERNHRFLEESLELVQSLGCTASEAHQLVDYVFGRPVGDPPQEVGGVMVTLAALCLASGLDMHDAGEVELTRISAPEVVAKIRAKQAAKPTHSPLPQSPTPQADSQPALEYVGNGMFKGETIQKAAEHWANWCDVRCMTGLSKFLRVVAARAPADSVLEDAARLDWLALAGPVSICVVIDRPHDGEVEVATDDVTGYGKTLREALDAARKQGGA